jgi:hypothetical protein
MKRPSLLARDLYSFQLHLIPVLHKRCNAEAPMKQAFMSAGSVELAGGR